MHVFSRRGLYGVHSPAWSVPEIAQGILAFRMPVFGHCFHFHDCFSQPHACLGILLQWHIIPLLFALCLGQVAWSRKFIIWTIGLLLAGGFASSLITLDQHYQWTDWSHRLVYRLCWYYL